MKKYIIKTLGCKTNQIESNLITEKLDNQGYSACNNTNEANIFILNSCSVTSTAEQEAIKILKRAKRDNPQIFTILTGCMAQLEAENLQKNDFIDLVLGNSEKLNLTKYLQEKNKINVSNIFEQNEFIYERINNPTKSRAYLKIQDGCNNRCTYCTIWKARGKSRSNNLKNILEQVKTYIEHGFDEIVLTGIHIGQWGSDLSPKMSFIDVIKAIEETDIKRYRLGSLDPFELNEELLEFLSKSKKFCPHFHMSLQSACNKTLKSMNRHYSVEHYLKQIELINKKFDKPFIGSDIIVGFPGETNEDFEETYKNIEKSGLTMAHIFPYSIRKDTIAAEMKDQISQEIKQQRLKKLKNIVDEKFKKFELSNISTTQEVIFEKNICKKTGMYKGLTANYLTVYCKVESKNLCGKLCKVRIMNKENGLLLCTPI